MHPGLGVGLVLNANSNAFCMFLGEGVLQGETAALSNTTELETADAE